MHGYNNPIKSCKLLYECYDYGFTEYNSLNAHVVVLYYIVNVLPYCLNKF